MSPTHDDGGAARKVGMVELITAVGAANIRFQNLLTAMTNIRTNKRGISKITFETDVITATDVGISGSFARVPYVSLVLWLPKDKVEAALLTARKS